MQWWLNTGHAKHIAGTTGEPKHIAGTTGVPKHIAGTTGVLVVYDHGEKLLDRCGR